jgi:hypothetical protein
MSVIRYFRTADELRAAARERLIDRAVIEALRPFQPGGIGPHWPRAARRKAHAWAAREVLRVWRKHRESERRR